MTTEPELDDDNSEEVYKKKAPAYYNLRYASIAKRLLDHMKTVHPKAWRFKESKNSKSCFTMRNQFYQGARYLIDKIDPSYKELRDTLIFRVIKLDSENFTLMLDWREKARNEREYNDIDELINGGFICDSLTAFNRDKVKEKIAEKKNASRQLNINTPELEVLPNAYLDNIMHFLETAPLESPPLIIEGLNLSVAEKEQVLAYLEDESNLISEVTPQRIYIERTTRKI